jgi:CRISPR-associated protein Csb1
VAQIRDGAPNLDARVLGGVIAKGRIEREVTVNLVALRGLRGKDDNETTHIRKYLLSLSLLAATAEIELFLREGCHLRYAGEDVWYAVPRRGDPEPVNLAAARNVVERYTVEAANHFRPSWQEQWPKDTDLEYAFDLKEAKKLLAKKTEDEPESAQ